MDASAIGPGKRVRIRDGHIGTVERLIHADGSQDAYASEADRTASMIVRSDDGHVCYRFPLSLVQRVNGKRGRGAIRLALSSQDLPNYVIEGPDTQDAREEGAVGAEREDASAQAGAEMRVPLAEEQLAVRTQPVELGTVHLHKGVQTHVETGRVPVQHDEIVVERIPADQYDASRPADPDETIVPLLEERLVVEKRTVVTEYIRIRKQRVETIKEVQSTLRREHLDISQERVDGTSAGPELHYPDSQDTAVEYESAEQA